MECGIRHEALDGDVRLLESGEQQRFALEPRVLLLDEPFSALNTKLRIQLRSFVRSLQREVGTTTLLVTHDREEALELSDRIVVMREGRGKQVGAPSDIYDLPPTTCVAGFLGAMRFLDGAGLEDHMAVALSLAVAVSELVPAGAAGTTAIGIRPEDVVHDNRAEASRASVESVTLRGHYKEISLRCGTHYLRSYVPRGLDVQIGETVGVPFRTVDQFAEGLPISAAAPGPCEEETMDTKTDEPEEIALSVAARGRP